MRSLLPRVLAAVAGVLLLLARASAQGGSPEPIPTDGPLAGTKVYAASHALIIGISEYATIPAKDAPRFAAGSATDVWRLVVRSYGFPIERTTVLLNQDATKRNIEAALSALTKAAVGREDRVLVYYSGLSGESAGDVLLVPHDARLTGEGLDATTCIPVGRVKDGLDRSLAKHVLTVLDVPYFPGRGAKGLNLQAFRPEELRDAAGKRSRAVIAAADAGEPVREAVAFKQSVFTHELLDELDTRARKPGSVHPVTTVFDRTRLRVSQATNREQMPQLDRSPSGGEFLFIPTRPVDVPAAIPAEARRVRD
jgi:hypothetical protein